MTLITRQPNGLLVIPPLNGVEPTKIPCTWERGAFSCAEAARYLGISRSQLWKRNAMGLIRKTIDGTYSRAELDRYLREGLKP